MWHGPVKCCSHHQPLLLAGQGPSPSIGDVLLGAQVSFRWYGEGRSPYATRPCLLQHLQSIPVPVVDHDQPGVA